MNIQTAKQQIKDTVQAYLEKDDAGLYVIPTAHQRPVFLLGAPGIGKTAIMEQIAQELGIGIVSYSMTHHTRQSALGLPRIETHEFEGFEYEASEYTMSEIIASIYEYMARTDIRCGILFLDEINCVSETLYPSMLQFLQFKTFGKHKIPDDWIVVCAGNPPEYNKSVHEFDIVTLDRMREIDVEPDYATWKAYAIERGIHPAVTSFLEAKKDCFYRVESKPGGGKSFVTARGWEDLADLIALYEELGKPVNRELFVQFLRDGDIADQFAVYYTLFDKYRSDYQVDTILNGEASDQIKQRAKDAEFDERVALISLILDMLSGDCANVLEHEAVVVEIRDLLRAVKPELLDGGSVDVALGSRISEREAALARKIDSATATQGYIRRERLVNDLLKKFVAECSIAKTPDGQAAFDVIEAAYKGEVASIKPEVESASSRMDNAFDFIDACFGNRELLIFMAELATRRSTTQFVAHYGNEKYYKHNNELQVDSARMGLADRAEMLNDLASNIESMKLKARTMDDLLAESAAEDAAAADAGSGMSAGAGAVADPGDGVAATGKDADAGKEDAADEDAFGVVDEATSDALAASAGSVIAAASEVAAEAEKEAARNARNIDDEVDISVLKSYYNSKEFEYGFASVCKMLLPASDMRGKKVLDIGSRRGRGVYKISSMVGNEGEAIGIDWSAAYVAESIDGITRAWKDSGLKGNNMDFRLAYPENLIAAGIGSNSIDIVYVNNVVTLFYDQEKAIREMARVLKPGGLLIFETVFADRERNMDIVAAAKEMGNSIQAALSKEQNLKWLEDAGFAKPTIQEEYEIEANRGYKAGETVDIVPGDEDVKYTAVCLYLTKK